MDIGKVIREIDVELDEDPIPAPAEIPGKEPAVAVPVPA
jgi:hypothetical protein